tara:strand:+ start:577 stop:1011 length:435 start_codon:yes stop_codon:yes gene_type:complete
MAGPAIAFGAILRKILIHSGKKLAKNPYAQAGVGVATGIGMTEVITKVGDDQELLDSLKEDLPSGMSASDVTEMEKVFEILYNAFDESVFAPDLRDGQQYNYAIIDFRRNRCSLLVKRNQGWVINENVQKAVQKEKMNDYRKKR